MRKTASFLLSVLFCISGATATPLTPESALSAVLSSDKGLSRAKSASDYSLAYTVTKKSAAKDAAVYVFAGSDGDFLVTAADDSMGQLLLGYGDSGFNGDKMPESLRWWLSAMAKQAEDALEGRAPKFKAGNEYMPIAPLVKTHWNQSTPWNNMCPIVNGERSVVGCSATAAAQIMKYHNWPPKGVGSHGGVNFGATRYDWNNMLNDYYYPGQYNQTQADAVALLSWHAGVAFNMSYSPYGSGANIFDTMEGLVNYLDYDKSIELLMPSWYSPDEWNQEIHRQLEKNQPVFYTGFDETGGGHAFVADGYSNSGLFHINWGWGGYSDGYFLLPALNPSEQGIGGSAGHEGFAYNQMVLTEVKPQAGSPVRGNLYIDGNFATDRSHYKLGKGEPTVVVFAYNTFSIACGKASYDLAMELVYTDGHTDYEIIVEDYSIDTAYGYGPISMYAEEFPKGEYDLRFVFKTPGFDWEPMRVNYPQQTCLHFVVTDNDIYVTGNTPTPRLYGDILAVYPEGTSDEDVANENYDQRIYNGKTYTVEANFDANYAFSADVCAVLLSNNKVVASGDPINITYDDPDGDVAKWKFNISIPASIKEGYYQLALATGDGKAIKAFDDKVDITIRQNTDLGSANCIGVKFIDSPKNGTNQKSPATIATPGGEIQAHFSCDAGPWSDKIYLTFNDPNNDAIIATSGSAALTLNTGDSGYASITEFGEVALGVTYRMYVMGETFGAVTPSNKKYYVQFTEGSGIEILESDGGDEAPIEWFNLQGVRINEPNNGLFLRRQGTKIEKIIVK